MTVKGVVQGMARRALGWGPEALLLYTAAVLLFFGNTLDRITGAAGAVAGIWSVARQVQWARLDPGGRRKAALSAAVRTLADGELWLDRDGHKIFVRLKMPLRQLRLMVVDEADTQAIHEDGNGVVTDMTYTFMRGRGPVIRHLDGTRIKLTESGNVLNTTVAPGRAQNLRMTARMARLIMFTNQMTAGPGELDDLIAALGRAERLGSYRRG